MHRTKLNISVPSEFQTLPSQNLIKNSSIIFSDFAYRENKQTNDDAKT